MVSHLRWSGVCCLSEAVRIVESISGVLASCVLVVPACASRSLLVIATVRGFKLCHGAVIVCSGDS